MGRRIRRRFWRRARPMIGWVVFLCLAVAGMNSWIESRTANPPNQAAAAAPVPIETPAAVPLPAPAPAEPIAADGTTSDATSEVWHCDKCGKNWPAWRLCCWVGTTRLR